MSLRTRLLIAIGVIAILALAIADVVTYSALESFLYQRIDQQLEASHVEYESWVDSGRLLSCYAVSGIAPGPGVPGGGAGGGGAGGDGSMPPVNVGRSAGGGGAGAFGGVVNSQRCAANVGGIDYTPQIPQTVTGFTTQSNGEKVTYFTAPATQSGGPTFRVRASILDNGDLLIVAQPLGDIVGTLHHLLDHRARRHRRGRPARPGRRLLPGADRPAALARDGADGRVHRRRQPHRACSR